MDATIDRFPGLAWVRVDSQLNSGDFFVDPASESEILYGGEGSEKLFERYKMLFRQVVQGIKLPFEHWESCSIEFSDIVADGNDSLEMTTRIDLQDGGEYFEPEVYFFNSNGDDTRILKQIESDDPAPDKFSVSGELIYCSEVHIPETTAIMENSGLHIDVKLIFNQRDLIRDIKNYGWDPIGREGALPGIRVSFDKHGDENDPNFVDIFLIHPDDPEIFAGRRYRMGHSRSSINSNSLGKGAT